MRRERLFCVLMSALLVSLWSVSGTEGRVDNPKLQTTSVDDLGDALLDVRRRRARDEVPMSPTPEVLLMADRDVPVQRIVEVVAVIRATKSGTPLFPDVVFATNFE